MLHARIALVAVSLTLGCKDLSADTENFGFSGASSEPQPGVLRPVALAEADGVARRGLLLWDMQRALDLGLSKGLAATGPNTAQIVFPLVDVDAGGLSGQVVFFRWKDEDVPDASNLDAAKAQRWILVSVSLRPDRVLDVEQLEGYVQKDGREYHRIAAALEATRKLAVVASEYRFRLHPLIEEVSAGGSGSAKTKFQTRVYAFGAGGDDPDYEVVLSGPERKGELTVLTTTEVHRPAERAELWIRTALPSVTPMTAARVLARGKAAGNFEVETSSGPIHVNAESGLVVDPGAE